MILQSPNSIKTLQTNLARDLVNFENSKLTKEQMKLLEEAYEATYNLLNQLHHVDKSVDTPE
jgi:hypothetical protein